MIAFRNSVAVAALAAFSVAILTGPAPVQAETRVTILAPEPPGEMEDALARIVAEGLDNQPNIDAVVSNVPRDATERLLAEIVAGPADGAEVVVMDNAQALQTAFPLIPIGRFLTHPYVLVARENAPFATIETLTEYARTNPVTLGHQGLDRIPTKVTLALADALEFGFVSDQELTALDCTTLTTDEVDVIVTPLRMIIPCLKRMPILVAMTEQRLERTPDVPTVKELRPEIDLSLWSGLFVHPETDQTTRDELSDTAAKAVGTTDARDLAKQTGAVIYWEGAEETQARIARDRATLMTLEN